MARIMHVCFFILLFSFLQSHQLVGDENIKFKKQRQVPNKELDNTSLKIGMKDIVDCFDIYKQPAFDHPLLRNHTIQLKPRIELDGFKIEYAEGVENFKHDLRTSCPEGTVPIQRTSRKDLLKTKKFANIQKKTNFDQTQASNDGNTQVELIISSGDNWKYYGAEALMDVYNISGVKQDQASIGQVMLIKGENGPTGYINAIHFGWGVYYRLNGDSIPRFFVYWTSDGYKSKGCFNFLCPGYVQISKNFSPGMVLGPGKGVIKLAVHRDPYTLNWLLLKRNGDNYELIGYFPKEIFNKMADASQVHIGGVVYSPNNEATVPPMGSGVRPGHGDDVCEFKQIALMNGNGEYHPPDLSNTNPVDPYVRLYLIDTPTNRPSGDGFVVQYGGPGGTRPFEN